MKMSQASKDVRLRMDAILALALVDKKFRKRLVTKPEQALKAFKFSAKSARGLAKAYGIGPQADCGAGTCRLSDPCGWTVCGSTTNKCIQIPNLATIKINPVWLGKIKGK